MSAMYRTEVPAYGTLMELVGKVNAETLAAWVEAQSREVMVAKEIGVMALEERYITDNPDA